MKTLAHWASQIAAEYSNAEAIDPWLAERPGVVLSIWHERRAVPRFPSELHYPSEGWYCSLTVTGGKRTVQSPESSSSEAAICAACTAFEALQRNIGELDE